MSTISEFIKKDYESRKHYNPSFSLRAYAKWLEMSPAQVSQIISGKRSVSWGNLNKISSKLGLSPLEERKFAEELMQNKLSKEIANKSVFKLRDDQFKLISDWYHFAILSLAKLKEAKSSPRWIAKMLGLNLTLAKEALTRLERLKIIASGNDLKQIIEPLEVTSEVPSKAIQKYHKQNLEMAMDRLVNVPPKEKEYQSVYLNLTDEELQEFKIYIDHFLDRALETPQNDKNAKVYALNVQLFPISSIDSHN